MTIVIRFRNRRPHSFVLGEGEDLHATLRRHLAFFPGEEVVAIEEQVYTPKAPRPFAYHPRQDLLALIKGEHHEESAHADPDRASPPVPPRGGAP